MKAAPKANKLRVLLAQAMAEVEDAPTETTAEALERWLADVDRRTKLREGNPDKLAPRTRVLYRRYAAVLAAEVGDVRLAELDTDHVLAALGCVSDGSRHVTGTSWQAGLTWLGRPDAMPKRKHFERKPTAGMWDEGDYSLAFEALLEAAEGRNRVSRSTALAALFCAACGLRVGEAVKLQRGDVLKKGRRGWWLRVKGKTGQRLVPMSSLARELLARCPEKGYLFPARADSKHPHVIADSVSTAVRRVCDRAGLPHVHTHWLRHAYASWLAGYGVPLPVVAALLGHKNAAVTYAYYFSASEAQMARAAEEVGVALSRGQMSLPLRSERPELKAPARMARVPKPKKGRRAS